MGRVSLAGMLSILALLLLATPEFILAKTLSSSHHYKNGTKHVSLEENSEISFIAIGDWGSRRDRQDEVSEAMGQWCSHQSNNCDFIISTGDNIYDNGVGSVSDKHFDDTWRDVYNHPGIADLPWYLTVGNHDHHISNGEWFQVEYSLVNSRWIMPSLAFAFKMSSKDTSVKFVSIDTISIAKDKNDADDMLALLSDELESADDAGWKVVIGHYPCHSGGHYAGIHSMRESVCPVLEENSVDFYLTGHDHNQQHWVKKGDASAVEHVVTGAGGQNRYHKNDDNVEENEKLGMELKFFDDIYGFSYFVVGKEEMKLQIVNIYGEVMHESVRYK